MNMRYDMAKLITGMVNVGMILYFSMYAGDRSLFGWRGIVIALVIMFLVVQSVTFIRKNESIWVFTITLFVTIPFNIRSAGMLVNCFFSYTNAFSRTLYVIIIYICLLSAEEIFVGLLARVIWPGQNESFASEIEKSDEEVEQYD